MRALLNKSGLSVAEFASATKIPTARVQKFIEHKQRPAIKELERIARAVGLPLEEVKDYLN